MSKLGLVQSNDFSRVVLRKDKSILIVIGKPDVFVLGDTYVVFGAGKVEDLSQSQNASLAESITQQAAAAQAAAGPSSAAAPSSAAGGAAETGPVDETGIEAKDIELVMAQAKCSRPKAVRALKNNNSDIVNAIMELTVS